MLGSARPAHRCTARRPPDVSQADVNPGLAQGQAGKRYGRGLDRMEPAGSAQMRGDGGRPASMVPMQPAPWTGPCASWAAATQPMPALEHSTAGHTSWTKAEELPGRRAAGDAVLGAGGWTQPVCPPGLGSSFERFEAVPAPGVRCVGESRAGVILVPRCLLPRPRFRTVPCEAPSLQPPAQPHLQALHVAPDAAVDHLQNLQLQRDGTGPQPQQYFLSQPDTESPACGTASSQPFSAPPPHQNPHLRR